MRSHHKLIGWHSPISCHRSRGGYEGSGDNRYRGNPSFFQFDAVEHTARAARPSIANSGQDEVRLLLEEGDGLRCHRVARGLLMVEVGHADLVLGC